MQALSQAGPPIAAASSKSRYIIACSTGLRAGHQTIIEAPAGSAFPQGPQPLIASLRDLQTVGAFSDFSLVRLERLLPHAIYLAGRAVLYFFHRGGLAHSYYR